MPVVSYWKHMGENTDQVLLDLSFQQKIEICSFVWKSLNFWILTVDWNYCLMLGPNETFWCMEEPVAICQVYLSHKLSSNHFWHHWVSELAVTSPTSVSLRPLGFVWHKGAQECRLVLGSRGHRAGLCPSTQPWDSLCLRMVSHPLWVLIIIITGFPQWGSSFTMLHGLVNSLGSVLQTSITELRATGPLHALNLW